MLLSNKVPLYAYISFYLSICQFLDIWVVPILGAIMNSTAMNIHI